MTAKTPKKISIIDQIQNSRSREKQVSLNGIDLRMTPLKPTEALQFLEMLGVAIRTHKPLIEMMNSHFPEFEGSSVAELEDELLFQLIPLLMESMQES